MKKLLIAIVFVTVISGCQAANTASESPPEATPIPVVAEESTTDSTIDRYEITVRDQSYGVDEIFAQKDVPLVISLRNQIKQPINVTIDELSVRSDPVNFGEVVEIEIPTDQLGEFEMYSSIGNRKNPNFSALLTIE